MHARTISAQVRSGFLEEAVLMFRDAIIPDAGKRKGMKGAYLLVDSRKSRITSLTFWETDADMRAAEAGGYYQARVARLAPLLTSLAIAERYEVAYQVDALLAEPVKLPETPGETAVYLAMVRSGAGTT